MKTIVHTYSFEVSRVNARKAYEKLCAELKSFGLRKFDAMGSAETFPPAGEVTLETAFLFANQWNTPPIPGVSDAGLRIFDWRETVYPNPNIKQGYWLEPTEEMREARRNRNACGFCGRQEDAAKGAVFCGECIDSEYLKESEVYLTRMQSVSLGMAPRPPLSEREAERLLPEYHAAQLYGKTERGKARIRKEREAVATKCERTIRCAQEERDGMNRLMDLGIRTDNVIFYDHTGRFCFGWRSPMSPDLVSRLLDVISEFGFPYDIKCADGRTLSGG